MIHTCQEGRGEKRKKKGDHISGRSGEGRGKGAPNSFSRIYGTTAQLRNKSQFPAFNFELLPSLLCMPHSQYTAYHAECSFRNPNPLFSYYLPCTLVRGWKGSEMNVNFSSREELLAVVVVVVTHRRAKEGVEECHFPFFEKPFSLCGRYGEEKIWCLLQVLLPKKEEIGKCR